ncbi:hypothetical protein FPV67DRAFT_168049 [Lyophyllum atratum]|nr:hypothetical protein FPV67DRAFT_168049 [Lyophyllum atratum]
MSVLNKITVERNQKTLLELVAKPGNDICADCKARNPRWASHSLGIFICVNCASIHRKIGTHVTKVKSLTMDMWSKEQVENMRSMGNANSNAIHNPNEVRHPPPANLMDAERDSELEQYIRSKYEFKRFMDKSALVSSKLGPTRSVTSVTSSGSSRSASSPLASAPPPSARPSTTTPSSQIPPKRPFAVTTPVAPTRSASQSLTTTQPLSQQPPQKPPPQTNGVDNPKGVWADLVSLQAPPSSSSLPLQFQMTSQTPISAQQGAFTGTIGSYQSSMGTGINPYQQQQHLASNPYSQQLYQTPGMQTSQFSSTAPYSPSTLTPQQPFFSNQAQMPPMSAPGASGQNNFFHPQPQQGALQIQVPNAGTCHVRDG